MLASLNLLEAWLTSLGLAPSWTSSSHRLKSYPNKPYFICLQFNMLDLIEEKTIPENCANFLDKALKEAKTPSELFLPQTHAQLK